MKRIAINSSFLRPKATEQVSSTQVSDATLYPIHPIENKKKSLHITFSFDIPLPQTLCQQEVILVYAYLYL